MQKTENLPPVPMPVLDYPVYSFSYRNKDGRWEIFDRVRRKYLALTAEEWVRQHTVMFLNQELQIPAGLIVQEKSLVLNRLSKRADILVYGKDTLPKLLVECKRPEVSITQEVFEQISRYNLVFRVKYLVVTNGITHYSFIVNFNSGEIQQLDHFPDWSEINLSKED